MFNTIIMGLVYEKHCSSVLTRQYYYTPLDGAAWMLIKQGYPEWGNNHLCVRPSAVYRIIDNIKAICVVVQYAVYDALALNTYLLHPCKYYLVLKV